jgi:hypothetical protein
MRKLLAVILFLILVSTSYAQEPHKVYLPIIMRLKEDIKNSWQIVKPISTVNSVLNPSAELTGNFAAVGSATITRVTTYQKYGLNSYRVQTTATNTGLSLTTGTLTNATHWMTARIRGRLPRELRFSIGPDSKKAILLEKIDDAWALYGALFGASESNGRTAASITQFGTGSGDFYVDGIQVEAQPDWTTYVDGTQEGCAWDGVDHASTSSRSGESSAGGIPQDLYQEYKFFVTKIVGAGASTQELNVDSYALLPGGEMNSLKVQSRQFTLIGKFITDTELELHDNRQELIKLLKTSTPDQPLRLRFNNARVEKEISVFYQGGLEGDLAAFYGSFESIEDNQWGETKEFVEKAAIQFLAPDPYWYEVGESAASLNNASSNDLYTEPDTIDTATFRLVAGRLRSTGQWDALGPPNVAGTYFAVNAIAEDATYVYIGGNFQNFDNIANADYIIRYNKQTGVYSALSTGMDGPVNTLAIGPNGILYAGGSFTSAGGVANTLRIASWDGVTWAALGTGANNVVRALVVGQNGLLFAGGSFTTIGGVAANRIASWDGIIWTALSTGMNQPVFALTIAVDGILYAGGSFTTVGGVATNYITSWNGSAFSSLGSGMNNTVTSLAANPSGILYAGGIFTSAGGNAAARVASWNGTAWLALGSGADDEVQALAIGQDAMLYAGGQFTTAGGINLADRVARWNGYSWAHLDLDLPGSPIVTAILASKYVDPVIKQKYNLFLGFDTTGTGYFGGKFTVTNSGNVPAFPLIIYFRSGGTFAIVETLKNERTGKELLFDYSLLSGETLGIDLTPTNKTIISSFFGPSLRAILANSDFGSWALLPGDNDVTTFVSVSGGPTLTAYLLWRDTYDSWD